MRANANFALLLWVFGVAKAKYHQLKCGHPDLQLAAVHVADSASHTASITCSFRCPESVTWAILRPEHFEARNNWPKPPESYAGIADATLLTA